MLPITFAPSCGWGQPRTSAERQICRSRGFLSATGIQFGAWRLGSERALSTPLSSVVAAQKPGLHQESAFRPMFEGAAQAILQMWNHVESRNVRHPRIRSRRIDRDILPPYAGAIPR